MTLADEEGGKGRRGEEEEEEEAEDDYDENNPCYAIVCGVSQAGPQVAGATTKGKLICLSGLRFWPARNSG